jgi:curli production assembly/transport component CsgG/holdfast attachment protein HfaB
MASKAIKILALISAASVGLSGCLTTAPQHNGLYANPAGRAPVTANPTPYSAALVCLGQYARQYNVASPRIAIGRIEDKTGKAEADGSGRKITLGGSEMAVSAFAKAGANLVERFDTSVSEMELKYANNKLISDSPGAGQPGGIAPGDIRTINAGQVPGSNFYLTGAITEVNFNIRSTGSDASGGEPTATGLKLRMGGRTFVMNVAIDLRLVDTVTLQIVDVVSYQKQIVGYEVSAGVFDFLNGNMFDLSAGEGGLEPMQLAVRSLIERATVEFMANLYGMPGPQACMDVDPLGDVQTAGLTGAYVPAYNNLRTNNAESRADPYRWNDTRRGGTLGRY